MTPEQQIALWADKMRDISAMGLRFADNIYDQENYHAIQTIAADMLAMVTNSTIGEIEPLKTSILNRPTPFSCGDGAVIDKEGRILLIKRADNGLWAMPGGAFAVGETPAEGAMREVLEETGVFCHAIKLIGVFDSRFCGTATPHHLYQFLFLCDVLEKEFIEPSHKLETLGVDWFLQEELPAQIDPGHKTRIQFAFQAWAGETEVFFDKPQRS